MELTIEQALKQGVAAHKEGKLEDAERLYRAILQSQPAHPDANHNLGVLAVSVNKANVALPLFKTALEANPKIEQFWLSYLDALIKQKQFEAADQVINRAKNQGVAGKKLNVLEAQLASKKKPENVKSASPPELQLNALLEHYQGGRFGDAEKLATSISQEFPQHQFAWKVLGAIFGQTGRNSEAAHANQIAVTLSPQDAAAQNNFGNTLKALGRLDEAEVSYTRAIVLKPDYAEAHSNLGITLQELGRLGEAEASYTQAIAIKPDFAEALCNLGATLQELARLEEAEASLRQALALNPDFAEAHYNLGKTLKKLGRVDEAEASYTQAITLKPNFAEAHNNLGNTLQELGRSDEAEVSWNQAISLKPDYADALGNRWLLLFGQKRYEAALKDADLCISKGGAELGLTTLYALGRTEEIYKRIEVQSKIDSENIGIAAFATFFSESEKKSNSYNFCPNPIDFIYVSNLSCRLKDSTVYITELIKELSKVETIWEPPEKTTTGGFQTLQGMNLFKNPSEKIAQLKSIIIEELHAYYLRFQHDSCSYIQKCPPINNLFGWHVILKHQGHQSAHIHTSGWLSGVIYLKVVPSLGKDEGAIEFSINGVHYYDVNSPRVTLQPEVGDIVFFPSSLHHKTIPFTTDADRIIISFDLMPEAIQKNNAHKSVDTQLIYQEGHDLPFDDAPIQFTAEQIGGDFK